MDCIFCKIVLGEIKSSIIYKDEDVVAFKDLNPQAPTHILIVPVKHIDSLSSCTVEDERVLGKIQLVASKIASDLGVSDGFRLITNNGTKAGQTVKHLHYHLLAGRRFKWPPG